MYMPLVILMVVMIYIYVSNKVKCPENHYHCKSLEGFADELRYMKDALGLLVPDRVFKRIEKELRREIK